MANNNTPTIDMPQITKVDVPPKKSKKVPAIIGILVILIIGVFVLVKAFALNNPPETPKQIVRQYLDIIEKGEQIDIDQNRDWFTEELLKKREDKGEVETKSNNDTPLILDITKDEIFDGTADVVAETKLLLPIFGEFVYQIKFKFIKDGSFIKGYKWKIDDIITPDLGDINDANKENNVFKKEVKPNANLEILSQSVSRKYDYVEVVGEVKNNSNFTSDEPIIVTATFYDKDNNVVGTEDGYIFNSIGSGKIAPFKIMWLSNIDASTYILNISQGY